MNITAALAFFKTALISAGMPADRIVLAQELARPTVGNPAPSATVYSHVSRYRRRTTKINIPANELRPPVEGAVGGIRHGVMGGTTLFELTLQERSMVAMENLLSKLFEYLADTDLEDGAGNAYRVLPSEGSEQETEIEVQWNDHTDRNVVTCTLFVPVPGAIWRDHPLIPFDVVIEYRLDGGNPDE